jgi:hypothetical protein
MRVAAVLEGFDPTYGHLVPWLVHREALALEGIEIGVLDAERGFAERWDALIAMPWLDWNNPRRFDPKRIMPFIERHAAYRARHPEVVQITCNHIDMSRRPWALPYWRAGDPILCRTPPYDRGELAPFPPDDMQPYEMTMGSACLVSREAPRHRAGFIGTPSGDRAYRIEVARETAKVGIGICHPRPLPLEQYRALLAGCAIVVCPRGWGPQSARHWDAWRSGQRVLTDAECDAVEMIPGVRLRRGVHYLVYDDPAAIPDIVSDWSQPSRHADAARIADAGRRAALGYDPLADMLTFFRKLDSS